MHKALSGFRKNHQKNILNFLKKKERIKRPLLHVLSFQDKRASYCSLDG